MHKLLSLFLLLWMSALVSACTDSQSRISSGVETPKEVAEQFWKATQDGKLDTAKQWVSWNTADYLKYFDEGKLSIRRVELGEVKTQEKSAADSNEDRVIIETVLVIAKEEGSDVRIPNQTVLIKTENVWRVQLKQTMTSVISKSVNEVAEQFNQLLQEGMQGLGKALSGSMDEISKSLEEGSKGLGEALENNARTFGDSFQQFQQELERKMPNMDDSPKPDEDHPSRKEI